MARKVIIHNYLPARDVKIKFEVGARVSRTTARGETVPAGGSGGVVEGYEYRPEGTIYKVRFPAGIRQLSERELTRAGNNDADDFQRYAGDVVWTDVSQGEYNKLHPGDTFQVEGIPATVIEKDEVSSKIGRPTKYRVKVRLKASGKDADWTQGRSPFPRSRSRLGEDYRVTPRAEEERNRDRAYKKTGITRVGNDGGPGSGPRKGGGKRDDFPEAKGWKHLPPATQRQLEGIQREINKLESQPWSEKLDAEHAKLMKKRHELGWENPWMASIVSGMLGGRKRRA